MNNQMIRNKRWISIILIFILVATAIIGSSIYLINVAAEESDIYGEYVGRAGDMTSSLFPNIHNETA